MYLLIVESPGKVKKIQSILGSDWTVAASFGHIRDLPLKELGIDANYTPEYRLTECAETMIPKLKSLAKEADIVYLATDPDREGEAIAWHLSEVLKSVTKKYYRVAFSEITEKAIKAALANPRQLDMNLVRAQEARRVLDRLVGYKISPKVSNKAGETLSAGRVQSVALRVIVETEEAIKTFVPINHYSVGMIFDDTWKAELETKEFIPKGEKYLLDNTLAETIAKLRDFTIAEITDEEKRKSPPAPFTTSTLQRAAQNQFGFSPTQTMKLAQELYERGHITYMRTDSPNLSDDAYNGIKEYCAKTKTPCVPKKRTWEAKESAQEAHEAIRPADVGEISCGNGQEQQDLYKLIRNRTIASQMPDAVFANRMVILTANRPVNNVTVKFIAKGSTLISAGWKTLTDEDQAEEDPKKQAENPIPQIEQGATVIATDSKVLERKTVPPSRYSQSGLIEIMEKRGVGRPATYAAIMDNIMGRGYIQEDKKGKRSMLVPTPKGEMLLKLLRASDMDFLKYEYTSDVEQQLDDIAMGKKTYKDLITNEDKAIYEAIERLSKQKGRWSCPKCGGDIARWQDKEKKDRYYWACRDKECKTYLADINGQPAFPSTEHKCRKCNKPLILKNGKKGQFWSCTGYPDCKQMYSDKNGKPERGKKK